jgi:hypothetical protein
MTTVYSFLPSITLIAGGSGTTQNTPMNERKITLHKGILNRFEVKVFNADRKPINFAQKEVFWHIIQHGFGAIALGPCTIVDQSKGKLVVELNDADIGDFDDGLYHMTFSVVNPEGEETYLYSNLAGGVAVVIEIETGMFMELSKTNQTMKFVLAQDGWFYTDSFQPRPGNVGIHTVSYRMYDFTGQIKAERTLDTSLSGAAWKLIELEPAQSIIQFDVATQSIGYTFEEDLQWVRFAWKPLSKDSGQVDKIIYRS